MYANAPEEVYSADLCDLSKFSHHNKGNKYALIVVDCFSRRLWVYPIKNKKPESVLAAYDLLFEKHQPTVAIHTDLGECF